MLSTQEDYISVIDRRNKEYFIQLIQTLKKKNKYNEWVSFGSLFGSISFDGNYYFEDMYGKDVKIAVCKKNFDDCYDIPIFKQKLFFSKNINYTLANKAELIRQLKEHNKYDEWVKLGSLFGTPCNNGNYFYTDFDGSYARIKTSKQYYEDGDILIFKCIN